MALKNLHNQCDRPLKFQQKDEQEHDLSTISQKDALSHLRKLEERGFGKGHSSKIEKQTSFVSKEEKKQESEKELNSPRSQGKR